MIEFAKAEQPNLIVKKLVELFYAEWHGLEIVCVFRSKHFPDNPRTVARIEKINGLKSYLWHKLDGEQEPFFLIQIVKESFDSFEPRQQIAILDHELSHIEMSEQTGEPVINPFHDIEENNVVVKRHGAYNTGLQIFLESLDTGERNQDLRSEILARVLE